MPTESRQSTSKKVFKTPSAALLKPLWLIDVHEGRLKPGIQCEQYLALSYVWEAAPSGASTFETCKANLDRLQENGAFYRANISQCIPQTIKDVLQLTRLLGERYLWIDRFCIVQDDSATKAAQIQTMASVYTNAYMTVAVCSGDAYDGVQGIPGAALGRDKNSILRVPLEREDSVPEMHPYIDFHDPCGLKNDTEALKFSSTSLSHLLKRSTWAKRAWTLQEQIFSRRAIYIFNACIVWECHCAIWHEYEGVEIIQRPKAKGRRAKLFSSGDLCWPPHSPPKESGKHNSGTAETRLAQSVPICLNRFSHFANGLQHSPWPDLFEYSGIVRDYSARKLTYSSDAIVAFTGITETLSRVFENGFLFGLPEMFFDLALLWHPNLYANCHRRAIVEPAAGICSLPSWSWIGWEFGKEKVNLEYWLSGYDYIRESQTLGFRMIPIVEWYVISSDGQKRNVTSNIPQYCSYKQTSTEPLPMGWEQKGDGFIHECDSMTTFRYPIPIQDPGSWEPEQLPTSWPLLSFKTTGGTFDVVDVYSPAERLSNIMNRGRNKAGRIIWDDKESKVSGNATLIAIPKAVLTSDTWSKQDLVDLDLSKLVHQEASSEFYFVLCVKLEDGIAYRLGLGAIKGNIWETETSGMAGIDFGVSSLNT